MNFPAYLVRWGVNSFLIIGSFYQLNQGISRYKIRVRNDPYSAMMDDIKTDFTERNLALEKFTSMQRQIEYQKTKGNSEDSIICLPLVAERNEALEVLEMLKYRNEKMKPELRKMKEKNMDLSVRQKKYCL